MKTMFSFFRNNRNNWELYVFLIVVCLAFSALFISNDNYVYTTEIKVKSKPNQVKLASFDTASMSVYQTILKNPNVIISAKEGLQKDYNIVMTQSMLVKSITTAPILSGKSLRIKATSTDPELATAMGKQVTKSLYYVLKSYVPQKQVSISSTATLKNARNVSVWYALLVSVSLGSAIGLSIQLVMEARWTVVGRRGKA